MHARTFLLALSSTCSLVACGDDDTSEAGSEAHTGADTTAAPTTQHTPTEVVGSETSSDESTSTGDSETETGETGEVVGCQALPLPDALVHDGAWDEGLTIAGLAGFDGFNPGVHDLARDGDAVLAVGYFNYLGQTVVPSLARREGGVWMPEPTFNNVVLERPTIAAVAAEDGKVAIATHSSLPGDLMLRSGEILVREDGEFQVVATFKGAVRRMVWFDGALWVGGVFKIDGEAVGPGLAVYGAMGWEDPPGGALEGAGVYALTVADGELLVGGDFVGVGGVAAQSVAGWDGAAWTAYDLPMANVYALTRDGQDLYAGGLMSVEGSFETGGIARWSGDAWTSMAGGLANSSFRGVVGDMTMHAGALYVAGCFSSAGGVPADPGAVPARDVVRWTGDEWQALTDPNAGVGSAWFSPLACGDEGPAAAWDMQRQRLLSDGDELLMGGFFSGVDRTASQSVVSLEGETWVAEGTAGRGFSGATRALAVGGPDCAVHVMGGVTHAGVLEVGGRVLRDDEDGWTPVGPPVPEDIYCWQLAVDAEGVPVLGCDGPISEEPATGVVLRLEDDAWGPVGDDFLKGGVATVGFAVDGTLWAAGGGVEGFVARLEGEEFVETGAFDGRVSALALRPTSSGELVVGGYFTTVDGVQAGGVARWDGAAWQVLGEGLKGSVVAVAYAEDGAIYASTSDDGTPDRKILARWDGAAWTDVATPEPGPVMAGYAFNALVARGKYVVAAGFAWPDSGQRNVFVYDGASFASLRGGATAISVDAAVLAGDGLWFGGTIAEAGPPDARVSSVGVAHLE